jgi:hypothetical protein
MSHPVSEVELTLNLGSFVCDTNHFDVPNGQACPRCGKVIKRETGHEIDPPEIAAREKQ